MSNLISVSDFEKEKEELIKRTIAKDATATELDLFLYQCRRTKLDPLAKQIYFQKRKNRKTGESTMVIITGIDGYRVVAERTGAYAGSDDAHFTREDSDLVATVTVYRIVLGIRCSFTASARLSEYKPKGSAGYSMWDSMPKQMLAKCAEALALRKAFPADLSGLYTKEELDQSDTNKSERADHVREVSESTPLLKSEHERVADYVVTIGKYSGQSLSEIGPDNVSKFVRYFEDQEARTRKPIEGKLKEVLDFARAYLSEVDMQSKAITGDT